VHKLRNLERKAPKHALAEIREDFHRIVYAARLPADEPLLVVVNVNRGRGDFSRRDRLLMELLRPHRVQAYQNAEAVTELRRGLALLDHAPDGLGRGLVILNAAGRIRYASRHAEQWLGR
jgi:hypothetical protein